MKEEILEEAGNNNNVCGQKNWTEWHPHNEKEFNTIYIQIIL